MRKVIVVLILSFYLVAISPFVFHSQGKGPWHYMSGPMGSTDHPWTMFRGNSLRSGATVASGPASNTTMWSFQTSAQVYSSPAISDGLVFVSSDDGNVYAIDEYSGIQRWVFATNAHIRSSPAVLNGLVFVTTACPTASAGPFLCHSGSIYALDEQSGTLVWQKVTGDPITSSPLLADGRVFYGSLTAGNGHVYALYANNGVGNWTDTSLTDRIESSLSVHSGRLFVGELDGSVVALNEISDALLWRVVPADNVQTALAVGYGMVFVATTTGGIFALSETSGTTVWFRTTGGFNTTSVALSNGTVFYGTGNGTLYARNATAGAFIWSRALGGGMSSSPTIALGTNTLFVGSNDHRLYALSMATGVILWTYLTGAAVFSSPAVADGRVFFSTQDGKIYAVGTIPPTLHASITASPTNIRSGANSSLTITVTNGTNPQQGVSLTFTASTGGSFSQSVMTGLGTYTSNFTAPTISSLVNSTIQVTVSRTGFVGGTAQAMVTLEPLPGLNVTVSSKSSSVQPGGNTLLTIRVTNSTLGISRAALTFSSSAGGNFSGVNDAGNGSYTVMFKAPAQSVGSDTITVQASKLGFAQGQGQTVVSVGGGFPDLTTLTVAGVSFFFILIAAALAVLLVSVVLIVRRRKASPRDIPPESSFSY